MSRILRAASISGVSGTQVSGSRVISSFSAMVVMSCLRVRRRSRAIEKPQDAGVFGHQGMEGRGGDAQKLAVFGCLGGDNGGAVLHQPTLPEGIPRAQDRQDRPVGVRDVDAAGHNKEQMRLGIADGIQRLACIKRDAVDGVGQFGANVFGQDIVGVRAGKRCGDIDGHVRSRDGKGAPRCLRDAPVV
jgi:hypothetical protein